jgi:hypothetical protein
MPSVILSRNRPSRNRRLGPLFRPTLLIFSLLAGSVNFQSSPSTTSTNRFDGPAELPRVLVKSSMADTPAPGSIHMVNQGANLQQVINNAVCGDTVKLQAGAVFQGVIQFPAKACDDDHWIVVRTSASNEALPAAGTRLTPCYAGVASLPGRPDFHCGNTTNVLARLEFAGKGGVGPVVFSPGANHYRLFGLEITRTDSDASISALAQTKQGGTANHIIFDRVWIHGTAQGETRRGVEFSAMTYGAVIDSFFTDFHCIAVTGSCTDAQTISAGGGDNPEGPFKIVNNFLEAAGENLMFGGRPAKTTPADIEIRRNHLFKPMTWMQGQPGFVGGTSGHPFVVKNHFEMKNAQRVLFEDNMLENNWGGFTQAGFSIVLSPKSQQNLCPICQVSDITIRNVKICNVGSVFQIANALSDSGGSSSGGERYSIHDILVEGVHGKDYRSSGVFALVISVAPALHDVHIEHVTAFVPRFIISILNPNEKIANFTLANSLLGSDMRPEIGSAGGGPQNCAFQPGRQTSAGVFNSCFEHSAFTHNLIVGGTVWPKANIVVGDAAAAGVRDPHRSSDASNLCKQKDEGCKKASPAIGAASDGKDIGADIVKIESVMAEVI